MKKFMRIRRRIQRNWQKMLIRYLLPGKLRVLPDTLTIELSNRCTLACSCCPNGCDHGHCRPLHTLTLEDFRQLLGQIDIPFRKVFLHLHGEPFLAKDLPQIVLLLIERGVEDFSIFSNAYHIDQSLLNQLLVLKDCCKLNLAFSAELYDSATYEKIRCPGKFADIWQSLEQIDTVMEHHKFNYSINAIITPQAIDILKERVPEIFARLQRLGNLHFSSAFPWPHLPETGEIAGHLRLRRRICNQIWELPSVLSSGEVAMCSCDYRGESIVGSLRDHTFSELINNQKARNFRRNIALRRANRNTICSDCLIDRHIPFSRVIRRHFIEQARPDVLERYFENFHKYFLIDKKNG